MNKSPLYTFTHSTFRRLLASTYVVGITLLIIIATLVTSNLSSQSVQESLNKTGIQLVESFAQNSRLALLYQSEDEAKLIVDSMLAFPDILQAGVYDDKGKPIYLSHEGIKHWGISKKGEKEKLLDVETDSEWIYSSPVYTTYDNEDELYFDEGFKPQLLGYVQLKVGKGTLAQLKQDFYIYNFLVIGILAMLVLWVLLIVTNRVTKPIHHLAESMQTAASEGKFVEANTGTTQDIVRMERAFNNLMEILQKRQSELLVTRDLALEAAKVKGEFAANVSHELRTPLNGISGMLELLSEMSLSVQQQQYIEVASSSADSLLELIDDVLDFSVYDQKDITFNNKSFNLQKTLEEFTSLLSPQAHQKNISIAYFIDEDVPINIISDSARLQQILHNLLGNAIKFTQEGDVSISVSKHVSGSDDFSLLFEITDTGIGIPVEAQAKVFEAFSQADSTTTREYGGTGLGLAICRQLVTLFGGEIGVNSSVESGSTFWFTIKTESDDKANASLIALQNIEPGNQRILYVGDNSLCKRFMAKHLNNLSYTADFANNGNTALRKAREEVANKTPYDFIIIDELRIGLKQSALAKTINADKTLYASNVVLTLKNSADSAEQTALGNEAFYLTKPVRESDLLTLLSQDNINLHPPKLNDINKEQLSHPEFVDARILVVEDNRANQLVAKAMLERFKCHISVANNGKEAIDIASRSNFDLIFMDCQMPEMDGYEATYQLRKLEEKSTHTTIVAMTANKQEGDKEKCLAVGMDDFLSKPLKLEKLATILNKWLNKNSNDISIVSQEGSNVVNSFVIDEEIYSYLEETLGGDMKTVLELFIEDTPGFLTQIEYGIKNTDLTVLSSAAHTLKSSAANFGATQLSNACEAMEQACSDNDTDSLLLTYKRIDFESKQVLKAAKFKLNPDQNLKRDSDRNSSVMDPDTKKILLVDDDRTARFTIKKTLEKQGYLVNEAISGEQALQYCERIQPDLIIVSAIMPGIDGFETCEKITHRFGKNAVPIIMITALDNEASINKAFEVGSSDYISKPINFSLFKHRVERLLSAKHAESQISDLAYKDPLTGLINRNLFSKQTADILAAHERKDKVLALMFLDLNRFKLVNDSYGHEAGDLLLKVVSERLTRSVRTNDIVSRFGGDEFVIALTDIKSTTNIESLARKIQSNLTRPFVFLGKEMHIGTSIGISVSSTKQKTNISTLIKNADIAMYKSKENKKPYVFYDQAMEDSVNNRLTIENDLRGAIERNELKVFYQPQFNIATGELIGMEALIRWLHPEKGFIPPDSFIGLSEETGQIHLIGEWVLETACNCLKEWLDLGAQPITVAVNLSAHQLGDDKIVDKITSIVDRTELPRHLLELEITEGSVMNNEEAVIEKLNIFKKMGIKLAIDDFGTGYSSLSYLKRFPINLLKIDRSFVMNSLTDRVDADIIRTIIILAHSMGVDVIAEGIETKEQCDLLENLNCDLVQGYMFGKPMPAEDFEEMFFPQLKKSITRTI